MDYSRILLWVVVCCLLLGAAPSVVGGDGPTISPAAAAETTQSGAAELIVSFESDQSETSEMLVSFESDVELNESDTPVDVEYMKSLLESDADRAQEPLKTLATGHENITLERQFWLTNAALVRVANDSALEDISAIDGVERIVPNARVNTTSTAGGTGTAGASASTSGVVESSSVDTTWGIREINATEVWNRFETKGAGATVAVLDTGVDPNHPDIDLSNWAKFDSDGSKNDSVSPQDYGTHGTHVSGTVTGGNASGQYIGVAPGAQLHHGAVLTECNPKCGGTLSQIIGGMEWATNNGVDVISMSLGANGYFEDFIDPIQNAESAGITVVSSVGNNGEGESASPGNVYDAISVGATDDTRDVATFSSGELVDTSENWSQASPLKTQNWPEEYIVPSVSAPGVFINSSLPDGGYGEKSGTSMAAPHVSGVAVLAHAASQDPVGPNELETTMEQTAFKPGDAREPAGTRDKRHGSGIVNASAVVDAFADPPISAAFGVSPQPAVVNETVSFDAGGSEGNITSYQWNFDDGTTTTGGSAATTHEFESAGEYNVTLTVEDSEGKTDTTNNTVTVESRPLNASFQFTPESPYTTENVTFDANDSEGDIGSYSWDFDDGATATTTSATTNHTYDSAGSYQVELTIENQSGQTDTTSRTVDVQQAPELNATFTVSPEEPRAGNEARFNASNSTGLIESYEWSFGDGATATTTSNSTNHTYDSADTYQVNLTVSDGAGGTNTTNRTITVREPELNASFTVDPANPRVDEEAIFNASESGGNVDTYAWDFDEDGVQDDTGENVTRAFGDSGITNVTLTVSSTLQTDSVTRMVQVGIPPIVGQTSPNDLNDDGLYHDVNGDGWFSIIDVQALFLDYDSEPVQNHTSAFDFGGDGGVDLVDVQALFDAYLAGEGVQ